MSGLVDNLNAVAIDDASLVRDALEGSARSFERLVLKHQVPILRFLKRRLGRTEDAEDVLQETFAAVHRNLHRYDARWQVSTWIFTIARRQAASYARRAKLPVEPGAVGDDQHDPNQPGVDARMVVDDERDNLWTLARQALSGDQFDVLWMFYAEQMSLDQVAKVTDKSSLSTRVSLHRARQKLKRALQTKHPEDRR